MATKLSENMSKLIHGMGWEREDRIISISEEENNVASEFWRRGTIKSARSH